MIITLLSDFGSSDPYVGIMKGVILGINPSARLVDLTHEILPQNIRSASFVLSCSYKYFPEGTVHLAVVDPGVGTQRRPVVVFSGGHIFVGPDNGLFSFLPDSQITVHLENQKLFLADISQTFHGRDIFAPSAAHLSSGIPLGKIGDIVTDPVLLPAPRRKINIKEGFFEGEVLHVDCFGNIVTNFSLEDCRLFSKKLLDTSFTIRLKEHCISHFVTSFQEGEDNTPCAILGSSGFFEIFIKGKNAASFLGVESGDCLEIQVT